jgi:hypothetical protein
VVPTVRSCFHRRDSASQAFEVGTPPLPFLWPYGPHVVERICPKDLAMSIERIFHCDGPDCERHGITPQMRHPMFLTVIEGEDELYFCGWDCVLSFAARKEPEEIIPCSLRKDNE